MKRTDTRLAAVCATYGDDDWCALAVTRALPSIQRAADKCGNVVVHHYHHFDRPGIHTVRNRAFADVASDADWVVFVDADDELDENYLIEMRETIKRLPAGQDFIIQPSTLGVVDGKEDPFPVLIPPKKSIWHGNHCVIGSAVPTRLVAEVGGFDDWPAWEDWGLWVKCHIKGAQFTTCEKAIYRVGVDTSRPGRNSVPQRSAKKLFSDMVAYYRDWESQQ